MNSKIFLKQLQALFENSADAKIALAMKAYMKNRFEFLGLKRPARDLIQKELFNEYKIKDAQELEETVRALWKLPYREYHYVACDLLAINKNKYKDLNIEFLDFLISTNSWWDTVELISANVIGGYYLHHKKSYKKDLISWTKSSDYWKRRACIIFQLKYKNETDIEWLSERILENNDSKEFFLQKAIGWALRQYSQIDAKWVIEFTENHSLKPLSKREALRLLNK